MTLASFLSHSSGELGDQVAIEFENRAITFSELNHVTDKVAARFRACGIEKGDRVALFTPTSLELIYSYLGNFKNGSIVVPINPQFKEEIVHILRDSGAKALMTDKERLSVIEGIRHELPELKEIILTEDLLNFDSFNSLQNTIYEE